MNNLEYYKKEIYEILKDEICVLGLDKNNKLFNASDRVCGCDYCIWNLDYRGDCTEKKIEWLLAEHKEQPTITSNEKKFLEVLAYKYLARDKSGILCAHKTEPLKYTTMWIPNDAGELFIRANVFKNVKFDFIKWGNEEPWAVKDLLKLEVKDDKE